MPGPTNLPERVLRAMHRASEDHRAAAFPDLYRPVLADLAAWLGTGASQVAVFPATGTGAWEVALINTVPRGATLFLPCAGQFADLWADTAARLGYTVARDPAVSWGDPPDPARIAARLAEDARGEIAAVLIVHNETSTGVTADLPAVRAALDAAGHAALLMADGVSSIGSLPYHHDAWRVDVGLTGSQKGLMLPAGLAIVALSTRALELSATLDGPRGYFDLRPMLAAAATGYTPFTPSIPMLHGLAEALAMLHEEGKEAVWARHHRLANGVRAAAAAWGLATCCRSTAHASDTVTTILLPDGVDGRALIAEAHASLDLALGAGLGPLAGRAFRIGHLGDLNEGMLLGALGLVELALARAGVPITLGSGVAAALETWR
ncbi:MAG TPA: aminotransferase class V-fold PLP-dependent enzyme [Gemmatimonadales bacterium]|nr:aminotransferase class V-fold PLP-dependent enzyme [Gemmatimonadales bacterium]